MVPATKASLPSHLAGVAVLHDLFPAADRARPKGSPWLMILPNTVRSGFTPKYSCPTAQSQTEAGDNLVKDQQGIVPVAQLTRGFSASRGCARKVPACPPPRFKQHGRDLAFMGLKGACQPVNVVLEDFNRVSHSSPAGCRRRPIGAGARKIQREDQLVAPAVIVCRRS